MERGNKFTDCPDCVLAGRPGVLKTRDSKVYLESLSRRVICGCCGRSEIHIFKLVHRTKCEPKAFASNLNDQIAELASIEKQEI